MADSAQKAQEEKDKGNQAFSKGDYEAASVHFTEALKHDPNNHILFSNRSGAYASLKRFPEALDDANRCVALKPDWSKGYGRKALAHFYLQQYQEAIDAYKKGLELDPNNDQLKKGLQDVMNQVKAAQQQTFSMFGELFNGDVIGKLKANKQTAALFQDPSFEPLIKELQREPSKVAAHFRDPRVMQAVAVLAGAGEDEEDQATPMDATPTTPPAAAQTKPKETPKPEEPRATPASEAATSASPAAAASEAPEDTATAEAKAEANREKELGNEAYKKREFEAALSHYTRAAQLDPNNMVYPSNRAAVHYEMKNYDQCIEDCKKAVDTGRSVYADFKQIARALQRLGNAYTKQENFDEAIKAYNQSLLEHRNGETLTLKQKAEKLKEEKETREAHNPELALEEKNRGNEFFRQSMFPEAIKCYTEAIRRNKEDPIPYSNRAVCYTKLGEYPSGVKDCEDALKLNPKFVKAIVRKGNLHALMKDYAKAIETYNQGLQIEPNNQELQEGQARAFMGLQARQEEQERSAKQTNRFSRYAE